MTIRYICIQCEGEKCPRCAGQGWVGETLVHIERQNKLAEAVATNLVQRKITEVGQVEWARRAAEEDLTTDQFTEIEIWSATGPIKWQFISLTNEVLLEVIDKEPKFFKILTNRWPGRVCVVIFHDDKEGVARYLNVLGMRVDLIISVHSHEELLKAIDENGIAYYFQCNDAIIELPQSLKIFRMHVATEGG